MLQNINTKSNPKLSSDYFATLSPVLEPTSLVIGFWSMLVSMLLVRCSEGVRWSLHRKDPGWVVGERRQFVLVVLVWRASPPPGPTAAALSVEASISMILLSFIICIWKRIWMKRYPLCVYDQFKFWRSFKAEQIFFFFFFFCMVITGMMMESIMDQLYPFNFS